MAWYDPGNRSDGHRNVFLMETEGAIITTKYKKYQLFPVGFDLIIAPSVYIRKICVGPSERFSVAYQAIQMVLQVPRDPQSDRG